MLVAIPNMYLLHSTFSGDVDFEKDLAVMGGVDG
jgi:hypothetical protein